MKRPRGPFRGPQKVNRHLCPAFDIDRDAGRRAQHQGRTPARPRCRIRAQVPGVNFSFPHAGKPISASSSPNHCGHSNVTHVVHDPVRASGISLVPLAFMRLPISSITRTPARLFPRRRQVSVPTSLFGVWLRRGCCWDCPRVRTRGGCTKPQGRPAGVPREVMPKMDKAGAVQAPAYQNS